MRKAVRSAVVTALAFVVVAAPSVALADGRVALAVGNSTYAHIGRLPNPDNDARGMSAALRRLGFEVTTELDADGVELTEALRAFTRQSAGADVSLVFYAGHGIEMDGVNYLIPFDPRLERDVGRALRNGDGRRPARVDIGRIVAAGDPGRVPERLMQRTAATRTVSGGQLRGPERGPAGRRDAGGVCGGGGVDGGGRSRPEQPVHGGAVVASGDAAGDRAAVPPGTAAVLASTNGAQRPQEYHHAHGNVPRAVHAHRDPPQQKVELIDLRTGTALPAESLEARAAELRAEPLVACETTEPSGTSGTPTRVFRWNRRPDHVPEYEPVEVYFPTNGGGDARFGQDLTDEESQRTTARRMAGADPDTATRRGGGAPGAVQAPTRG